MHTTDGMAIMPVTRQC